MQYRAFNPSQEAQPDLDLSGNPPMNTSTSALSNCLKRESSFERIPLWTSLGEAAW
jgi:hypothetical protein